MIRLPATTAAQGNLLPDLTPLLDVIFIVLVFFLLTAQTPLLELPLQLPQSREALPAAIGVLTARSRPILTRCALH